MYQEKKQPFGCFFSFVLGFEALGCSIARSKRILVMFINFDKHAPLRHQIALLGFRFL